MSTQVHAIRSRMKINVKDAAERPADVSFADWVLPRIGDLSDYVVLGSSVLVASYVAPSKTAGGIILSDKTLEEDRWQGIVGLVLKLGESAFKYDGSYEYTGTVPKPGDYVMFHTSDTRETGINGQSCRLIDSSLVRMIIPSPDDLY